MPESQNWKKVQIKNPDPSLYKKKENKTLHNSKVISENYSSHKATNDDFPDKFFVMVKFQIFDQTFATKFKITTTVEKIQENLLDILDLEKESITLMKDGSEVKLSNTLGDFISNYSQQSKIVFQISSPNGDKGMKEILAKVDKNVPTLDVITVHYPERYGDIEDIVVEIDNQCCQKEWLGGFRNKLTSTDYHNASSQTAPKPKQIFQYSESGEAIPLVFHRDTQTTLKPKDVVIDTVENKATQMWKTDNFIPSKSDKIITAKPYISYDKRCNEHEMLECVIKIQRRVRKWLIQKKFREVILLHKAQLDDVKKQKAQIVKEQTDKEREIITNATYPVKRDDFYMLYLMVEKWWKKEWKRICELKSAGPRKADAVMLLAKEVKLLENIEKHRIASKSEALKKERMRFLEQMARPYIFKNKSGKMISVDNLETQRAREFKEIYSALTRKDIYPEDRIDLLLSLKQCLVSHFLDYEHSNDLTALIQREIDLLTIGTKTEHLRGLHQRIEQLFMNFVEQKEFNLKAEKYIRPNMPKTMDSMFLCTRCSKLLPVSKFPVHVRMRRYSECKSCEWLKNIGHKRVDMSPYLKMLRHVQNSEMQTCCRSAVCFILQPIGMAFLTNILWHGQSAISECRDISKLQHIRWIKDVEWAPWNTILLTDQEAKCHASIPDVLQFYGPDFVEKVRQKHISARKEFVQLLKQDHQIRSTGAWSSITDSGPFLHPSHSEELATGLDYDKI